MASEWSLLIRGYLTRSTWKGRRSARFVSWNMRFIDVGWLSEVCADHVLPFLFSGFPWVCTGAQGLSSLFSMILILPLAKKKDLGYACSFFKMSSPQPAQRNMSADLESTQATAKQHLWARSTGMEVQAASTATTTEVASVILCMLPIRAHRLSPTEFARAVQRMGVRKNQDITLRFETRSACYRGPRIQKCPKWLREGAKGVLTSRRKRSPESVLHQCNPILHQCNPILHQCNPLLHQCNRLLVRMHQNTFCTLA